MAVPDTSRASEVLDRLVRDQQRRSLFRKGDHSRPGPAPTPPDDLLEARDPAPARVDGGLLDALRARAGIGVVIVIVAAVAVFGFLVTQRRPPAVEERLPRASATTVASSSGSSGSSAGPSGGGGDDASADPSAVGAGTGANTSGVSDGSSDGPVVVHVAGAVAAPGVVELPAGSRVVDAVRAAGGLRADADPDRVNLAIQLSDGQRVVIPVIGQEEPVEVGPTGPGSGPAAGESAGGSEADGPIDVNAADAGQLEELPGIGPATAAAIISHRESEGPFSSVDDLLDVRGIGEAKLEGLRDLVTVGAGG